MIIGFTGKAGCGKSSVAKAVSYGIYSFASDLKKIATMMGWNGVKDDAGRKLLQDIGTVGRDYNQSVWIDKTMQTILNDIDEDEYQRIYSEHNLGDGKELVYSIDDLRYNNEAEAIHSMGGIIIKLKHRTVITGKLDKHPSEVGISEHLVDYTIPWDNLGTVITKVEEIIKNESNRRSKGKTKK